MSTRACASLPVTYWTAQGECMMPQNQELPDFNNFLNQSPSLCTARSPKSLITGDLETSNHADTVTERLLVL